MVDNTFTRMDLAQFDEETATGVVGITDLEEDLLAALRAAYAEMDRLRANALEWVTVTEDPASLPDEDGERDVLVDTVQWDDGEPSEMRTYYVLHLESDSILNLNPGDRWAYIPRVQS